MAMQDEALARAVPARPGMVWVPGGVFQMGSDRHYAEEAPVHQVQVDGFWMDAYPVTNAEFRCFVEATGYTTAAERSPNPEDYPGDHSSVDPEDLLLDLLHRADSLSQEEFLRELRQQRNSEEVASS